MEPEPVHLKRLLEGCLRKDRSSQKMLYREFYSYGMSICLRYADSRDEAAEILNDGFMNVFKNLEKFDFNKPFKPWLRKIVINLAINLYRQKQRQINAEEINDNHRELEHDRESVLAGISYQELIELLQKLPPAYRTAFNLYVIEGYSHEEIATMLNISAGTSKSNLFKARGKLKKIVGDFFELGYV